ncbi:MAG: 50S ribosomal protein L11 methyltransferase [Anaerolineales bacterium]
MDDIKWLEVSVPVDAEAAEAVAEVLSRYASQGVAIDMGTPSDVQTVTVRAYLPADESLEETRRKVEEALWHLGQIWPIPTPTYTTVADRDWTAGWKEKMPVLHIGQRVVIKPSWRDYRAQRGEVVLEMDPGLAFGTGIHPTTQLCLGALERLVKPGMRVLDLGTGTGVLAIAAVKLADVRVLAVDNSADAVRVARRNARVNDVAGAIDLLRGSLADVEGTYDLVVANILASTIVEMARSGLAQRLEPGGGVIASGILQEQRDEVVGALEEQGLPVSETLTQEDWVALIARKPSLTA